MKFLIDAQLPPRLARALAAAGHHAVHTLDLPEGNRTTDRTVAEAADADDRVLITKDGDFRDSHRLRASPRWLLIVTTGNVGNDQPEQLNVNERHVRRLVFERRIPYLKWGHLLRFDPVELEQWLEQARIAAPEDGVRRHR